MWYTGPVFRSRSVSWCWVERWKHRWVPSCGPMWLTGCHWNTGECHPMGPCGSQDATETQLSAILWAHVAHRMPLKHRWVPSYGPMWLTGCHWSVLPYLSTKHHVDWLKTSFTLHNIWKYVTLTRLQSLFLQWHLLVMLVVICIGMTHMTVIQQGSGDFGRLLLLW